MTAAVQAGYDAMSTRDLKMALLYAASNGGGGGGGVSQIVAGTNITVSPSGGTGTVTVNASGGGLYGTGSPQGVVTASPGTPYADVTNPNAVNFWVKASGNGNTGWYEVAGS
jgi:hypothetical protein